MCNCCVFINKHWAAAFRNRGAVVFEWRQGRFIIYIIKFYWKKLNTKISRKIHIYVFSWIKYQNMKLLCFSFLITGFYTAMKSRSTSMKAATLQRRLRFLWVLWFYSETTSGSSQERHQKPVITINIACSIASDRSVLLNSAPPDIQIRRMLCSPTLWFFFCVCVQKIQFMPLFTSKWTTCSFGGTKINK